MTDGKHVGHFPNAARTEPAIEVGDVVAVRAMDWAVYNEQTARDSDWLVVRGTVYGEVITVTADGVAIAPQVFDGGDVRGVLMIPLACIEQITILTGVA